MRISDLSHFNGFINWSAIQLPPDLEGIMAKATDGLTDKDIQFENNIKGARAAGLKAGAYHFFRPLEDPVAQAKAFIETCRPYLPMPMAVDLEPIKNQNHPTEDWDGDHKVAVLTFLTTLISELKGTPIIYTTRYFMSTFLPGLDLSAHSLWVADYDHQEPSLPPYWKDWILWQKSPVRWITGIPGPVDLDVMSGSSLPEMVAA